MTNMHEGDAGIHNPEVVAFLRYRMTPDEERYPRFEPVLRLVSEVPMGALVVHPDLIDRLVTLDPPDGKERLRMLMGTAVLIADNGVAYALIFSQTFLAVRLPPETADQLPADVRVNPEPPKPREFRGHQPKERVQLLGDDWTVLEPWSAPLEGLRSAVSAARSFASAATPR